MRKIIAKKTAAAITKIYSNTKLYDATIKRITESFEGLTDLELLNLYELVKIGREETKKWD